MKRINLDRIAVCVLAVMIASAAIAAKYTRYNEIYFETPVVDLAAGTNTIGTSPHESGTLYNQATTSSATLALPDAAVGLAYHVAVIAAGTVVIDPQASDKIVGLGSAAGDRVRNIGTIGDHLSLVGVSTSSWAVVGEHGTWSDIN